MPVVGPTVLLGRILLVEDRNVRQRLGFFASDSAEDRAQVRHSGAASQPLAASPVLRTLSCIVVWSLKRPLGWLAFVERFVRAFGNAWSINAGSISEVEWRPVDNEEALKLGGARVTKEGQRAISGPDPVSWTV